MSAQKHLHSVGQGVYEQILTAIEENPRAVEILMSPKHCIIMRDGGQTFFVLYTILSDLLILLVDDPQTYEVTWENDVADGTSVLENALEFFRDILEEHPEELIEDHLDIVMSLKVLYEAQRASRAEKPKFKRMKPLFGPRIEYIH